MAKKKQREALFYLNTCERGNIWIVHVEEPYHNAYFRLTETQWLEVIIRPCNYPGFTLKTIDTTDAKLAKHIRKEFGDGQWIARKMNLPAVKLKPDGTITRRK